MLVHGHARHPGMLCTFTACRGVGVRIGNGYLRYLASRYDVTPAFLWYASYIFCVSLLDGGGIDRVKGTGGAGMHYIVTNSYADGSRSNFSRFGGRDVGRRHVPWAESWGAEASQSLRLVDTAWSLLNSQASGLSIGAAPTL